MKPSQLRMMISALVAEEIRLQLPALMERVITERYLRGIVSGHRPQPARGSLREILQDDEEPEEAIPEPPPNDHGGIYHERTAFADRDSPTPRPTKLKERTNPLSFVYEGVDPIPRGSLSSPEALDGGIPLERLGGDFGKMNRIVEGMARKDAGRMSARPAPRQAVPAAPRARVMLDPGDGPAFPAAPIVLDD